MVNKAQNMFSQSDFCLKMLGFFTVLAIVCGGCNDVNRDEDVSLSLEQILKEIVTDSSFSKNRYLSESRANYYLDLLRQDSSEGFQLQVATELLNAGRTLKAIHILETLIDKNKGVKMDGPFKHKMETLLSIARLRKGEQDNCIRLHNGESCILPLQGAGIYTVTESTEAAIHDYLAILNEYPNDLKSIWLLNIAYMALGWYPDSVPSSYLINPVAFESEYEIERFENIGSSLLIASSGLAGGCCVEDFDNDGFQDIIVSSMDIGDPLRYYRNTGDGSFEEITISAGLMNQLGGLNIIHADFDNDGYADVFVLRGGWFKNRTGEHPNSLLKNNGDGTFTDVTVEAGL